MGNKRIHHPAIKKTCLICGKEFKKHVYLIKLNPNRFCSVKCAAIWRGENNRGVNNSSWRGGLIERECEICGKHFKRRGNKGKFCSMKCWGRHHSKECRGKRPRSVQCRCLICGKEFLTFPVWIKKGGGKYCSRKCQAIDQVGNIVAP